jgi:hypothetical protein
MLPAAAIKTVEKTNRKKSNLSAELLECAPAKTK